MSKNPALLKNFFGPYFPAAFFDQCATIYKATTIEDLLLVSNPSQFCRHTEITKEQFEEMIQAIQSFFSAPPITGTTLLNSLFQNTNTFSTGCAPLDAMLGGGLLGEQVIELWGDSASGKSQICHLLATNVALTTSKTSLYIDTAGCFSSERILQILQNQTPPLTKFKEYLGRVQTVGCQSLYVLFDILEDLGRQISENQIGLIIIDSPAMILSGMVGTQGNLFFSSFGFSLVMKLAKMIKTLAASFNLPIVLVNHAVNARPDTDEECWNGKKPALGLSWSFIPTIQVFCEALHSETYSMTLTKSPSRPLGSKIIFKIEGKGIECVQ